MAESDGGASPGPAPAPRATSRAPAKLSPVPVWFIVVTVSVAIALTGVLFLVIDRTPLASFPSSQTRRGVRFPQAENWLQAGEYISFDGLSVFYRDSNEDDRLARRSAAAAKAGAETGRIPGAESPGDASDPHEAEAKPVLLLLHGFPTSSLDFAPLWQCLALGASSALCDHEADDVAATHFGPLAPRGFRVLAPDFVGYGFSDKPAHIDISISLQVDMVYALLQHLRVEEVFVLAHDIGDTVAQEMLARDLDEEPGQWRPKIRAVAMLNGGIFPWLHRPRWIQTALLNPTWGPLVSQLVSRASFGRAFSDVFGPDARPSGFELDQWYAVIAHKGGLGIYHRLIGYMNERVAHQGRWSPAVFGAKQVPLVMILGPADPVSGTHVVPEFHKQANKFQAQEWTSIVELPAGVGHYPQWEDPASVLRALAAFWRSLDRED